MQCEFDPNVCSVNCKKYAICSFYALQTQLTEVQNQLNFIYNTLSKVLISNSTAETKINLLESAVFNYFSKEDSYKIKTNFKESNDEKEIE